MTEWSAIVVLAGIKAARLEGAAGQVYRGRHLVPGTAIEKAAGRLLSGSPHPHIAAAEVTIRLAIELLERHTAGANVPS